MKKSYLDEYIDNAVREVIFENLKNSKKKKVTKPATTNINENVRSIQKNFRLLREYIEHENECYGDEMLDNEITAIDANVPEIDKFIENIKSEALDAMTQLSKNGESNSPTFETLKKVFDVCHNTQKKKEVKKEEIE